jgi:hypothetical protein
VQDDGELKEVITSVVQLSEDVVHSVKTCVQDELTDKFDEETKGEFDRVEQEDLTAGVEAELEKLIAKMSKVVTNFYQVPLLLDKPVGSRILPDISSSRSGVVYEPGEVVEVTTEVIIDSTLYLKTADMNGWLFDKHPDLGMVMMERVDGDYKTERGRYTYSGGGGNGAPALVRRGPCLLSKPTGQLVYRGEEVDVVGTWTPADGSGVVFLKLDARRGWVARNSPPASFYDLSGGQKGPGSLGSGKEGTNEELFTKL